MRDSVCSFELNELTKKEQAFSTYFAGLLKENVNEASEQCECLMIHFVYHLRWITFN